MFFKLNLIFLQFVFLPTATITAQGKYFSLIKDGSRQSSSVLAEYMLQSELDCFLRCANHATCNAVNIFNRELHRWIRNLQRDSWFLFYLLAIFIGFSSRAFTVNVSFHESILVLCATLSYVAKLLRCKRISNVWFRCAFSPEKATWIYSKCSALEITYLQMLMHRSYICASLVFTFCMFRKDWVFTVHTCMAIKFNLSSWFWDHLKLPQMVKQSQPYFRSSFVLLPTFTGKKLQ